MFKNEQDGFSRIQIQDELNAQADNSLDEMDVERIEKLVKRLNEYDKVKPDLSDYNRFLDEFNSKNGVKLQSSRGNKRLRLFRSRRTVFKICSKFASAAAVIVLAVFVSNAAVKADASDSISSWLSEVKNSVVFAFSDESYKEWVLNNEEFKQDYNFENNGVDYKTENEVFREMEITDSEINFDDVDWKTILKPNYIPEGFDLDKVYFTEKNSLYNMLSIVYNKSHAEYICITVEQFRQNDSSVKSLKGFDTVYDETLEFNGFTAYIFTGKEKSDAFLYASGKIYKVRTTLDKEKLQKILENMSYDNN